MTKMWISSALCAVALSLGACDNERAKAVVDDSSATAEQAEHTAEQAQNLETFDDLDFRVYSGQLWDEFPKSHAGDIIVHYPDGTTTTAGESWSGDLVDEEWVYFTDPALGRSLYLLHQPDDLLVDSYAPSDKVMTILGFGRSVNSRFLQAPPHYLTIGLVEESTFEGVAARIHGVDKPLLISRDVTEKGPEPTATPTNTPTITPT